MKMTEWRELYEDLRKHARDLPLRSRSAWLWDSIEADVDRMRADGTPPEDFWYWNRLVEARRAAKRAGHRPPGSNELRDHLIRWLVDKYTKAGLKRGLVVKEVAEAAGLSEDSIQTICPKKPRKGRGPYFGF